MKMEFKQVKSNKDIRRLPFVYALNYNGRGRGYTIYLKPGHMSVHTECTIIQGESLDKVINTLNKGVIKKYEI